MKVVLWLILWLPALAGMFLLLARMRPRLLVMRADEWMSKRQQDNR